MSGGADVNLTIVDSTRLISYGRPWIVDLSSLPGAALEDCVSP